MNINIMIMAGGKGERFWPVSTTLKPKQLIPIVSEKTMIEETVDRLLGLVEYKNIFISTNMALHDEINKLLPDIPEENYIIEPISKDTAPAVALGAAFIDKKHPGSVMVVLPADHLILEKDIFHSELKIAAQIATDTNSLITFGIAPTRAETGYGYIEMGDVAYDNYENDPHVVNSFKEKPNADIAKEYCDQGNYTWNSGMFVWRTDVILQAFKIHLPDMYPGIMEIKDAISTDKEKEVLERVFNTFDKISIDHGVMEVVDDVLCLKARYTWDDIGTWSALSRVQKEDENHNLINSEWEGIDTTNSIIINDDGLIATIGLDNILVVKSGKSILIADRKREQDVKKIVQKLKSDDIFKKYVQ